MRRTVLLILLLGGSLMMNGMESVPGEYAKIFLISFSGILEFLDQNTWVQWGTLLIIVAVLISISRHRISRSREVAQMEGEQRFREMVENGNDLIFILNEGLEIIFMSESVTKILGYKFNDILNFHFDSILTNSFVDFSTALENLKKEPEGSSITDRIYMKNTKGKIMFMEVVVKNCLKNPRIKGLLINARDISESEKAKLNEAVAAQRYTQLVQNSPDLLIIIDEDYVIIYMSPSVEEILGIRFSEIKNEKFDKLIHHEDLFGVIRRLVLIRKFNARFQGFTFRARNHEDEWVYLEATTNNQLRNPNIKGIVFNLRNITDRIQIQQKLIDNEAQQRAIIQSSFDAIWSIDTKFNLLTYNSQFEKDTKLFYNSDIYVGMQMPLHHVDTTVTMPWLDCYKIAMQGMPLAEHQMISNKMLHKHYEIIINPIRNANGKVTGIVCFSRDITERKKAETQLLKAKNEAELTARMKSEFLANMSHEIRTLLNGIVVLTELLKHSDLDYDQQENLRLIQDSADSLMTTINDILDFSKIEAGKMLLEKIPFNLEEVIQKSLGMLSIRLNEKKLGLTVEYDEEQMPKFFLGDPGRVLQVFTNLLSNAIKFTHKGSISVEAKLNSVTNNIAHVICSITDTGIGIEPEKLHMVFESFTQSDGSTTRRYGGTGLGLSIARNLVSMMNGTIQIQSKVNAGSKVTFEVQLEIANLNSLTPKKAPEPLALPKIEEKQFKVLVADDTLISQKLAKKILNELNYQVIIASSGFEVIDLALTTDIDLIFIDLMLPGIEGIAATRKLRDEGYFKPIIGLTASSVEPDEKKSCQDAGMNDFLMKPFTMRQMDDVLKRNLK